MAETETAHVAHQFDDGEQQHEAVTLGMWAFLATEIMLFGGLFAGYTVFRIQYFEAFREGSHHLYVWLGTANTAILLLSSFTMALAVSAAEKGHRRALVAILATTAALGLAFLTVKGFEYRLDIHDGIVPGPHFEAALFDHPAEVQIFFVLYWLMTALHATHMLIGVCVIAGLAVQAARGRPAARANTVEMTGLYWHFVDIVWIFLFPLLYLVGEPRW